MWYNLGETVRFWARYNPDNLALWVEGEALTWVDFNNRTDELAAGMEKSGISIRDRVAILSANCAEWCETVIAVLKLGGIVVPLNPRLLASELEYLVDNSGARLIVCDENHRERADMVKANLKDVRLAQIGTEEFESLRVKGGRPTPVVLDPDTPAAIGYTSGTTGFPKGATLSHEGIRCMGLGTAMMNGFNSSTRTLTPVPLAFTAGIFGNFLAGIVWGGTLYLLKTFDPKRALEIIGTKKINYMGGAVVMYEGMAAQPEFENTDMSSFFAPLVGASPVPLPLLKRWQKKGVNLRQGYGLTESSAIIINLPNWASEEKLSAIGFQGYSAEFRVVDDQGKDCAQGENGEILIRGPVVMLGYWNNPKATKEAIIDGWLHTGDVGVKDEDGFISIVDRVKDMIISGGINTYPAEIEKCIYEIDGVLEVAVIGIPNEKWGETVGALVRCSRDLTVQEAIDHCKNELADYKVPRYLKIITDPLPRTMSGKLVKRDIKKIYGDDLQETGKAR